MIFCYIPNQIEEDKLSLIKSLLNDRYQMFFTEVGDGIEIITETNQKILRDTIINYKPILFYMDSLIESNISPTILSELIIFILKQNCVFQSEKDNIYWESFDIDTVYPNIFELFRQKIKS